MKDVKISKKMYEQIQDHPAKAQILESIIRHQLYGELLDPRAPQGDKRSLTSAENGRKGGRPKGSVKRAYEPKISEIRRFCEREHLNIDPDAFYEYYTATGWKTGDDPVRSWQGLARTWSKSRDVNRMTREEIINALKA